MYGGNGLTTKRNALKIMAVCECAVFVILTTLHKGKEQTIVAVKILTVYQCTAKKKKRKKNERLM